MPHEPPEFTLGKLLLERRASFREIVIPLIIACCALIGGPLWTLRQMQLLQQPLPRKEQSDAEIGCLLGLSAFGGSFLLFGYCAFSMFSELRCFELGVTRKNLFYTRTLRFDEVESFTFSQKRSRFPPGTTYLLHFFPLQESRQSPLLFSVHVPQGAETEITGIRDHVADIMSERMEATLAAGDVVPWTPYMYIAPLGLYALRDLNAVEPGKVTLTADGLTCSEFDPWQQIPWELLELKFDQGDYLQIIDKSQNRVVLQVDQICDNFYPGLALAMSLQAEHSTPLN